MEEEMPVARSSEEEAAKKQAEKTPLEKIQLEIEALRAYEVDWEFKHQAGKRMMEELYPQLVRSIQAEHLANINLVEIRRRLALAREKKKELEGAAAAPSS